MLPASCTEFSTQRPTWRMIMTIYSRQEILLEDNPPLSKIKGVKMQEERDGAVSSEIDFQVDWRLKIAARGQNH